MRFVLPLLAAYSLLVAGGNTALYYLTFGELEGRLREATEIALEKNLQRFPGVTFEVAFQGRVGTVSGLALTDEGLRAARAAAERAGSEGLDGVPFALERLEHDFKRPSSFHLFERQGSLFLRSFLPLLTLKEIEAGLHEVRGRLPRVPLGEGGAEGSLPSVPQTDAQIPTWQDEVGAFVSHFFQPEWVRDAEMRVVDRRELWLAGKVETEEERTEIEQLARAAFPALAPVLRNEIMVVSRPFLLEMVDDVVALEGKVPSIEVQEALFDWIRRQGDPAKQSFVNALEVAEGAPGVSWLDQQPTFFGDLFRQVKALQLVIGPELVLLRGRVSDRATAEALAKKMATQLPNHEVTSRLTYAGAATESELP